MSIGYNLPPGVTGLEPQIAGYDEFELTHEVECLAWIEEEDRECLFHGEIEGTAWWTSRDDAAFAWTCPKCGAEETTDLWGYGEADTD